MNILRKLGNRIFIDGLSGMALGLFSTLIVGTIIQQIGQLIGGQAETILFLVGKFAMTVTGAGIGCGVAYKFKESPLVVLSAATTGMVGGFATGILNGSVLVEKSLVLGVPEPLGAFVAAYVGIELGHLVAGKTKLDILITPIVSVITGSIAGIFVGPKIAEIMGKVGELIRWGTEQQPILMGVIVSVLMGMILTLPISSAAIGLILGLSGISAGAATVGCCANMIGFAVASFGDNKVGGLLAQGLGTSMLQVPNIVKKPIIWVPAILTSAILGPVATAVFAMKSNPIGSGMGTSGLIGPLMVYQTMVGSNSKVWTLAIVVLMCFVFPGVLSYFITKFMKKSGWIKPGDMKLEI